MSGPQCGTYMIHPRHMAVDLPTNVNDRDISSSRNYAQLLESTHTDMTYHILRIKTSIIFREIVDAAADCGCVQDELPYDLILTFDRKLNEILKEAPPQCIQIYTKSQLQNNSPDLRLRRLIGNALNHLHRPYLARGARDPKYSYSRMVCLRSARTVIELDKQIAIPNEQFHHRRMWTIIHPLFSSVLVLVMDYCLNREEPRAEERKTEIIEGFRLLEACQEESLLAKRGLQQMRQLLGRSSSARKPNCDSMNRNAGQEKDQSLPVRPQDFIDPESFSNIQLEASRKSEVFLASQDSELLSPKWIDTDLPLLENMNFDVDMEESQFEELFRDLEGSNFLY